MRVIGIGGAAAGDDAVGLAVARRVRELAAAAVEVIELADPTGLLPLLERGGPATIVVDALDDGGPAGRVIVLDPDELAAGRARPLSGHGIGVADLLALARTLAPGVERPPSVTIVGVTIEPPVQPGAGLSPAVEEAVAPAAARILALA